MHKRYGEFEALKNINLEIAPGTVHAFLGANGAGKSTLLGMIAGKSGVSEGTIHALGTDVSHASPRHARDAGIVAIYQELTIVPRLNAADNVYLGKEKHSLGRLDRRAMRRSFEQLTEDLKVSIPAMTLASNLSAGDQQCIEIMRAVASQAQLVLLDEPTSSLAGPERQALFELMRRLRSDGVTMILVSHDLDEVLDIADRASVFRDGQLIETKDTADWTKDDLVRAMLGKDIASVARRGPVACTDANEEAGFAVRGLQVSPAHEPFSFSARPGEIVGIAGLMGSGRSSILRALGGSCAATAGQIQIGGRLIRAPRTPKDALDQGIVFVSEDRRADGFVPALSAAENFFVGNSSPVSRLGVFSKASLRKRAAELADVVKLAEHRLARRVDELSGGNQQKVVLGRAIERRPQVLLVDEPTRGIDIGAKAELLAVLRDLAVRGVAVVIVSSEIDELLEHSDRVLVVAHHRLVSDIDNQNRHLTEADVLELAFGVEIS
ncbi:sugar ABC transporter ATP-binding protein [Paenarthrobacter sp. NPDC091711]|uniref:sugar ABC transporter ATP-binding protein n=1 Tax=Paenarthrobacter sp. NPDC091711 TaxID=3364385 RepID=UPI0038156EC1